MRGSTAGETFGSHSLDHIAPPRRGAADLPEEFRAKVWRKRDPWPNDSLCSTGPRPDVDPVGGVKPAKRLD